jgi:hypothetical protein
VVSEEELPSPEEQAETRKFLLFVSLHLREVGVMVKSAIRFGVTLLPDHTVSPVTSLTMRGKTFVLVVTLETAYGLISRFFDPDGASMPTTVPASCGWRAELSPRHGGTGTSTEISFCHRTVRDALNPHICASPARYRSDLNGSATSTVHPPSNLPAARS